MTRKDIYSFVEEIKPNLAYRNLEEEGRDIYYHMLNYTSELLGLEFNAGDFRKPVIIKPKKKKLFRKTIWKNPEIVAVLDSDMPAGAGKSEFNYNKDGEKINKDRRQYHGLEITLTNFNYEHTVRDLAILLSGIFDHNVILKYPEHDKIQALIAVANPYSE
jgi:integrase